MTSLDLPERLHVAARRYCLERSAMWAATYGTMNREGAGYNRTSGTYSKRARDVFPRYQQLDAMRAAIERFEPDGFASLDDARAALIAACERAENPNAAVRADPISAIAIADERALLVAHLVVIDDDALWRERPLFYRRVLAVDELAALTARFTATFGIWYGGACDRVSTFAYRTFHEPLEPTPHAILRPIIGSRAARVFEWNEVDESVEQDVGEITFERSEACWFTADLAWMVYASHESTLTIAGAALLREVEDRAPAWSARRAFGT